MGLLLGDTVADESGELVTHIWKVVPQIRKDRRKDRVECSSTQMAEVAQLAEQETRNSGRTTRVVGWYHSHPHITALPSHVDVQTQASYQALDEGFVGIIVSCFNSLQVTEQGDRIQVIAFQSMQRAGRDLGGSDDDAEEDAQMRAALRESREEAARQEGPMWEYTLIPVSLVADGPAARDAALHDVVARINSLKLEEWNPFAEEMARLDAQPPPPAELFARTLYCTGVLQQGMSDLLQGSVMPTLTALHAQAFTIAQRRRAALDKLMMYQEAVNDKLVQPNPKLDDFVNQQIKHHLQLNDAAVAQEHSTHSTPAGAVPAQQQQVQQAPRQPQHAQQQPQQQAMSQPPPPQPQMVPQPQHAQQQQPQHPPQVPYAQQRHLPQQQAVSQPPPQWQTPRQPQHAQQAQQQPHHRGPQQQQRAWAYAKHPSLGREPSSSELQSGEITRGVPGAPSGHSGERGQPGHAGEEPGYERGPAGAMPYQSQSQPAPRRSIDAGKRAGVADMHAPYHQPQVQHQLQFQQQQHAAQQHALQQQAQHAQHVQTTQQAQHVPHMQMQQLQIQTAAVRAQMHQMAQHKPWHELDAAQHAQRSAREAAISQGQPVQHMYQHPGMQAMGQQMHDPAALHARGSVPHTVQPIATQVPQGQWQASSYAAGVEHLLPGSQERLAVTSAAETPPSSERHKWHVSKADAALTSDFLTRTGNSPTPSAVAAATGADARPGGSSAGDNGTASPSRHSLDARPAHTDATRPAPVATAAPAQPAGRLVLQQQRSSGAVRGSSGPAEGMVEAPVPAGAGEEAPPQNGLHEGHSAELPAAPAAPAGPGRRATAWGRQAPAGAQASAAAPGRGAARPPPAPSQRPAQLAQQDITTGEQRPVDGNQEHPSSGTAAPVGPRAAGAWGSGAATFASKLKDGGVLSGIGSAPQRAPAATAAADSGSGQRAGLTQRRYQAAPPAGHGGREAELKGGPGGQKGAQGEGKTRKNSRGGKGRSGRSGNLGDSGGQGAQGVRKTGGNSNRGVGRGGGGGGGGGGGEGGERSGRKG